MENDIIGVSICCLTYNHENYVRKTLEGFFNQKTDFKFEVLINDDASTDGTVKIIKEFEEKYPGVIKAVYQMENQYSQGKKMNSEFLFMNARGKYIAMCEGDDYWTDDYKLQKQYDILERHQDCSVSTHIVSWIKEDGSAIDKIFPPKVIRPGIVTPEDYMQSEAGNIEWTFQTSSYFFRTRDIWGLCESRPNFLIKSIVEDLPIMLYLITKGNIYYLPENMSCYRLGSSSSVTKTTVKQKEKVSGYYKNQIECMKEYNNYTQRRFDKYIDKYIRHYEYTILLLRRDFAKMMQERYMDNWNQLSIYRKLYYRILIFCPGLHYIGDIYNLCKTKLHHRES